MTPPGSGKRRIRLIVACKPLSGHQSNDSQTARPRISTELLTRADHLIACSACVPECPLLTQSGHRSNVSSMHAQFCALALLIDFWLDELRQVSQRLLPTEIASLRGNGVRQAFLHDV